MIRIADSPVMPSKPWEKFPGSNKTVVDSPESLPKFASRHEWPKCVNSMPILWLRRYPGGIETCD